ncbi:hypothetical protein AAEX63_02755 [Luteococcus sp. H138]|uniref:hypothetical protein n=1 Tax=unclassified Luteococcus TaxID=2639923 RepID=UPI00313C12F2
MTSSLVVVTGIAMILSLVGGRLVAVSARIAPTPGAVHRLQFPLAVVTVCLTAAALMTVRSEPAVALVAGMLGVGDQLA